MVYLRTIKDDTNICLLMVDDDNNTQRQQVKYSVYYLCSILERQLVFQKKKMAHAYFKRRIFLSLLAGKFTRIEQMSRTE